MHHLKSPKCPLPVLVKSFESIVLQSNEFKWLYVASIERLSAYNYNYGVIRFKVITPGTNTWFALECEWIQWKKLYTINESLLCSEMLNELQFWDIVMHFTRGLSSMY